MKLEKVLKELEVNYGWSFYDEKGNLHLEDMQKELLQDTIKAVKNLCISDIVRRSEQLIAFLKWVGDGHDFENNAEKIVKEYIDKGN